VAHFTFQSTQSTRGYSRDVIDRIVCQRHIRSQLAILDFAVSGLSGNVGIRVDKGMAQLPASRGEKNPNRWVLYHPRTEG
jgi:hypothetical protein